MSEGHKVIVSITGVQSNLQGEESTIELLTEGVYSQDDEGTKISYAETEMSGMEGSDTVINIAGDTVRVERSGEYGSNFIFKKGEKCLNIYSTPFGRIELGAVPLKVFTDTYEHEGEVDLEYQIEIQGQYTGLNKLRVCYWAAP
jgi:uncharacterized beta-barrel protein YwiB (DUF1934 family)